MVSYMLFGNNLLRSAQPFSHCLVQALGGTSILIGCALWGARHIAHVKLCQSIASGILIDTIIKMWHVIAADEKVTGTDLKQRWDSNDGNNI